MGHERFESVLDAVGERPSAVLARRLLSTGRVASVHIYGNMINVDLQKGFTGEGMSDIVRDLYQYWTPGKVPPSIEDLSPPAETAAAPAAGGGEGESALSAAAQRVPTELLERSRAALARWKETHAS